MRRISGSVNSDLASNSSSEYKRITTPGLVLPARPARWLALAFEIASIGRRCTFALGLYREILAVPASITYLMFGIVNEVSATLVARIILLFRPTILLVSKTRCCSAELRRP
ncbi:unannotated protein [freshwater metagenome]|uniref:Unannotated protein n=1 Tax=freshwater metagenome TaxID=449393 RepID=A0A6J6JIH8_9ZZZZ